MQLVKHVSAVIAREGSCSIEFVLDSNRRTLSIWFWKGKQFVCMPVVPCGRDVSTTKGYNELRSPLLIVISGDAPIIIFCGESSADLVKVLDKSPGR